MHTRDTFSILYYFIITQFSKARPSQSPPGLILILHLPLKHHSFTCILLRIAASSNFSAWLKLPQNKLCSPLSDTAFYCSSVVKTGYLQNRRKRSCDTIAVTTQPWIIYKGIDRVPAHAPISKFQYFPD